MHENRENRFRAMGKKMNTPPFQWCFGKYPGLCTILIKTSKCNLMFMVYHSVI